jgi:hypothetical protein
MPRPLLLAAIVLAVATAIAVAPARASAGAPSPTSTPLPPGATPVTIRVIHDLNMDGTAQPAEPGIEGIDAHASCTDALVILPRTDESGTIETSEQSFQGRVQQCYAIERPFGWLPTTPTFVRVDAPLGDPIEVVFLLHDLGRDTMEISSEVIVAGLPAQAPDVTLAPPYADCSEMYVVFANGTQTQAVTFVVSPAVRDGCPAAGSEVSVLVDGRFATLMPVQPGQRVAEPLAVGGDSMRLYATDVDVARIDGVDCGVVVPVTGGLIPPDLVRVFVLSEELRPGCGVTGRPVRFFRDGAPLDPVIPWTAGQVDSAPEFTPAAQPTSTPVRPVLPPDTGNGAAPDAGTRMAWLTIAIACTGVALLAGALVIGGSSHKR